MVLRVGDVDVALGVYGDGLEGIELAVSAPLFAPLGDKDRGVDLPEDDRGERARYHETDNMTHGASFALKMAL